MQDWKTVMSNGSNNKGKFAAKPSRSLVRAGPRDEPFEDIRWPHPDPRPALDFAWPDAATEVPPQAAPRPTAIKTKKEPPFLLIAMGCLLGAPSFLTAAAALVVFVASSVSGDFTGTTFVLDTLAVFFIVVCLGLTWVTACWCVAAILFWIENRYD